MLFKDLTEVLENIQNHSGVVSQASLLDFSCKFKEQDIDIEDLVGTDIETYMYTYNKVAQPIYDGIVNIERTECYLMSLSKLLDDTLEWGNLFIPSDTINLIGEHGLELQNIVHLSKGADLDLNDLYFLIKRQGAKFSPVKVRDLEMLVKNYYEENYG